MITFKALGKLGRMGNQLSQIASTIGIAVKNKQPYAFPYWMNYEAKDRFNTEEDIDMQKWFTHPLPLLEDDSIQFVDKNVEWGYHDLQLPEGNYNLMGHMQSEKYFEHCPNEIRFWFEMKEPAAYFKIEPNSCAIHIRYGDYDNDYHPIMTAEYYRQAISIIKERGCDKFYIFSDDIEKAMSTINAASKGINGLFVQTNSYGTMPDFYSMRKCQHFIIANSTYSWWAAWLGEYEDKIVIAPRKWFGEVAKLSSEDLYCKNWIVLSLENKQPNTYFAFNVYSQNGEDGILQYILSRIQEKSNFCIEFGAWDGITMSNTFNLVKNGYKALYIEGDANKFQALLKTASEHPNIIPVNEYVGVTKSLNDIIKERAVDYKFADVLSIDVDGMDYRLWESFVPEGNSFPRIVIIEINSSLDPAAIMSEEELTDELLQKRGVNFMTMVELGWRKGYKLFAHTGNCIFIHDYYAPLFNIPDNPMELFNPKWLNPNKH